MNKLLVVFIGVLVVILVCVGYYFIFTEDIGEVNIPDISEDTFLFDFSDVPVTNWDENAQEYKFHQKVISDNNQDVRNVTVDVIFYNQGDLIGVKSNVINQTENGTFDLDFKINLESEPDEFYYNVSEVNWT